jgi:carbonic anhydrase
VHKLVEGIHHFQANIFRTQRELFERLAKGQSPEVLFVTCSDSRINPNLITQTGPGELFILRNAGNIVPPHGGGSGGELATIEFALVGLGIKDIIVCGHSHCGAMKAILDPQKIRDSMPAMYQWLQHAESTRRIVREKYTDLSDEELLNVTIQENVLVQLEHLRSHPAVAVGLAKGTVKLHGWVYKMETGDIFAFDPEQSQFLALGKKVPLPAPPGARLADTSVI